MRERMEAETNFDLKPLNTFGVQAAARYFVQVEERTKLHAILADKTFAQIPKMILGGGSNLLFTKDFDGLVIKNSLRGIEVIEESEKHCLVKVMAGERWHEFVIYCIEHDYAGVENLSLIPGLAGAAPMQNWFLLPSVLS